MLDLILTRIRCLESVNAYYFTYKLFYKIHHF